MQRFAEITVLFVVISAFFIIGTRSASIIKSALLSLRTARNALAVSTAAASASAGKHTNASPKEQLSIDNCAKVLVQAGDKAARMQRKIVCTFVFFFITCLLRSVFKFFTGVLMARQDLSNPCAYSQCDPCKNAFTHIIIWMLYTPGLQAAVMLVVSPLALLIALWGMSDVGELEQMAAPLKTLQRRWQSKRRGESGKFSLTELTSARDASV